MNESKKYYSEINIARGIAILLVVLGHARPTGSSEVFGRNAVYFLHDFCYSFHMALFFILAGFVACHTLMSPTVRLGRQIGKRALRLLVPYAVYTLLTIPLKFFFEDAANIPLRPDDFWMILVGKSPNSGLWYLWTLFVISVLFLLLSRIKQHPAFFLMIGGLLYVGYIFLPEFVLNNLMRYSLFYALGVWICRDYDKIYSSLRNRRTILISAFLLFTVVVFREVTPVVYLGTALLGSITVLGLAIRISEKPQSGLFRLSNELGDYSYDIYLISYFVQIAIRVIFYTKLRLPYLAVAAMMFVFGVIIPYFISKYIVRRTKILAAPLVGRFN